MPFNANEGYFLIIVAAAALAAITVVLLPKKYAPPVVVVELLLGIVVGPQVLDVVHADDFVKFMSNLGLGMLFFFAGYEIQFDRIKGRPLTLALIGWIISLALAYGIGGVLASAGIVLSLLYTGSALATTAIGTLIPIMRDSGEMPTRFGTFLLAAGGIGEFGPILLITLVLSTTHPALEALILVLFVVIAVVIAVASMRISGHGWSAIERTLDSSSQLGVRIAVLLVFGLVFMASSLGLDILLGGFLAGMVTRMSLRGREVAEFDSKLIAVGFGLLIPFFFVTSGITFDLDSLFTGPGPLLKMFLFLGLFLIVRGTPAMLLYRGEMASRDRLALAFFSSTQLPLVVAITTLALDADKMLSSTAAALVGAAILSTLIFPFVGMALRRGRQAADFSPEAAATEPVPI